MFCGLFCFGLVVRVSVVFSRDRRCSISDFSVLILFFCSLCGWVGLGIRFFFGSRCSKSRFLVFFLERAGLRGRRLYWYYRF